jgi:MFS family permease
MGLDATECVGGDVAAVEIPLAVESDASGLPSDAVSLTPYFVFLFSAVSLVGFYDSFATAFRYRMTTYARQEYGVELSVMASLFTWIYLGSCLSFIPRVLADVVGRKYLLWLSLAGMCLLHWLLGFARSPVEYAALLTAVSIFYRVDLWLLVMSEEAPPRHRGTAMALMVAVAGLGTLALGELVKRMGSAIDAWRGVARFPIYGLFLSIPLLFFLRETRHFQQVRVQNRRIMDCGLIWAPFDRRYRRPLFIISLLKMVVAGGVIAVISIVETDFLRVDNGFGQEIVGWLIQGDVFAITAGWLVAGLLSDRIGRRPTSYLLTAVFTVSLVLFALLPKGSVGVMVFSLVHNFASSGIYAVLRVAAMEYFPSDRRATAVAWTDLWAALFAAVSSWFLGIALGSWHLSLTAVILAAGAIVALVMPLYQLLPETIGRKLEEV